MRARRDLSNEKSPFYYLRVEYILLHTVAVRCARKMIVSSSIAF